MALILTENDSEGKNIASLGSQGDENEPLMHQGVMLSELMAGSG